MAEFRDGETWAPAYQPGLRPEVQQLLKLLAVGPVQAGTAGLVIRSNAAGGAQALDRLAQDGLAQRRAMPCGAPFWAGTIEGRRRLAAEKARAVAHLRNPWASYRPARGRRAAHG